MTSAIATSTSGRRAPCTRNGTWRHRTSASPTHGGSVPAGSQSRQCRTARRGAPPFTNISTRASWQRNVATSLGPRQRGPVDNVLHQPPQPRASEVRAQRPSLGRTLAFVLDHNAAGNKPRLTMPQVPQFWTPPRVETPMSSSLRSSSSMPRTPHPAASLSARHPLRRRVAPASSARRRSQTHRVHRTPASSGEEGGGRRITGAVREEYPD
jgi:hypothetical protein